MSRRTKYNYLRCAKDPKSYYVYEPENFKYVCVVRKLKSRWMVNEAGRFVVARTRDEAVEKFLKAERQIERRS